MLLMEYFVKMQVLIGEVWAGDHGPAFLTFLTSPEKVMPVLLAHGPHFEQKGVPWDDTGSPPAPYNKISLQE